MLNWTCSTAQTGLTKKKEKLFVWPSCALLFFKRWWNPELSLSCLKKTPLIWRDKLLKTAFACCRFFAAFARLLQSRSRLSRRRHQNSTNSEPWLFWWLFFVLVIWCVHFCTYLSLSYNASNSIADDAKTGSSHIISYAFDMTQRINAKWSLTTAAA